MMATVSRLYLTALFLLKLKANEPAATTIMMTYWMTVTVSEAQKLSAAGASSVKLHCNILTAYFWNGKMAE